jgi:uncharacterized protein (UPF0332 family)
MRNTDLYYASYHLYKAATFLTDIDPKIKTQLLDMAKEYLDKVDITDEDLSKKIEEYSKIIKGEE